MTIPSIFKSKTLIDVWDGDLSKFVSEYYGRPWSMRYMELSNESYVEVDVSHEGPDYRTLEEAEQKLQEWLALSPPAEGDWKAAMEFDDKALPVEIVLWDLCRRGIAPEGEYLIRVWW